MEDNMAQAENPARAELVKKERVKRAFTQGKLAENAKVDLRTIQRLEKSGIASFETLRSVAKVFEVEVAYLSPTANARTKKESGYPDKELHLLPRLKTGKDITEIIGGLGGEDLLQPTFDGSLDRASVESVANFFGLVERIAVDWIGFNHEMKIHVAISLSDELEKLEASGLQLFGLRRSVFRSGNDPSKVEMSTLFVVPAEYPKTVRNEKAGSEIVPAVLRNFAANP